MQHRLERFEKACNEILEKNSKIREHIESTILSNLLPTHDPKGKFNEEMIEELIYRFMVGAFKEHMIKWKKPNNE